MVKKNNNIQGILLICLIIIVLFLFIKYISQNDIKETLENSGSKIVDYTGLDKNIKINSLSGPTIPLPQEPEPPTKAGCYTIQPTGCPKYTKWGKLNTWINDAWGEKNQNTGNIKSACMDRASAFNTMCGVTNTKMHFVP